MQTENSYIKAGVSILRPSGHYYTMLSAQSIPSRITAYLYRKVPLSSVSPLSIVKKLIYY